LKASTVDGLKNDFTVLGVADTEPVAFKLRASNACGYGEFSAPVYFKVNKSLTWLWILLILLLIILILACICGRWRAFGHECGGYGGYARREVTISEQCKFSMVVIDVENDPNPDETERFGLISRRDSLVKVGSGNV
jgi:hypothetical protein